MGIIHIENVHKSFGPKMIYSGLELDVEEGETRVIVGRSGEGKSVLLKHLCALMAPDSGSVTVDGRRIDSLDKTSVQHIRDRVTMVFQMGALFDSLTVRENVGFYLDQHHKHPAKEIDRICNDLLEEVNLPDTGHLLPAELSGGMRKRVGLARALAVQPKILLYDEPTTGLDPVTTDVIGELMLKTKNKYGMTSIVVTHDMQSAYKVADRISMLYKGKIIFTGTPEEMQQSTDPVIVQFITGSAVGPITRTEDEDVSRLSSEMIDRSLLIRRIQHMDDQ